MTGFFLSALEETLVKETVIDPRRNEGEVSVFRRCRRAVFNTGRELFQTKLRVLY